jgi:beta-lactam-binding protein with PASTA domain
MSLKDFLFSRTFLKNILISVGVILVLIIIILASLRSYTSHGKGYPVPALRGMTEDEFARELHNRGMKYKILDSVYVAEEQPGAVVDQVPKPGFMVKKNRTIFLTLNANAPEQVKMPKFRDISFRQAQALLENLGMKIGNIRFVPSEYNDLVLGAYIGYHEIRLGEMIAKGTVIDLLVGSGANLEKAPVPYVVGMTIEEARAAIFDAMFNPGVMLYDESVVTAEDSLNVKVWKQKPDPRETTSVEMGSSIDLWVTVNPEKVAPTEEIQE